MRIAKHYKICLLPLALASLICYQLLKALFSQAKREKNKVFHGSDPVEYEISLYLEQDFAKKDLPVNAGDLEVERIFIEASESVEIRCPLSARIGNVGDGGWDVCEHGNFLPKEPCIVYSFGIDGDWSFDDGIVERYNCVVRSFDPSMSVSDHWRKPRNVFLKEGLGGDDIVLDNLWRINTLKTIQHIFRDDDKIIDYVKFDIEGSEWPVLNTSIRDGSLLKVKQLAFEIHTDEAYLRKTTPIYKLRNYLDLLKGLRDLGFYRWYAHRNTLAPKFPSDRTGVDIWCCHEVVYLNINYF